LAAAPELLWRELAPCRVWAQIEAISPRKIARPPSERVPITVDRGGLGILTIVVADGSDEEIGPARAGEHLGGGVLGHGRPLLFRAGVSLAI
jgi:hypothetical protein